MPSSRLLPPLGFAAVLAAAALSTAWAVVPASAEPAAFAGNPALADLVPTEDPDDLDDLFHVPTPMEEELDRFIADILFEANELDQSIPLPPGTDTAALLADNPARATFFGEHPMLGGFHVMVSQIAEADGAPAAFVVVTRKMRREHGYPMASILYLAEWWRLNDDGSVTFLRAKSAYDVTADELPPPPAGGGGD